ncbi:MAG TPA: hypothetical protein VGI81_25505 [Tepidisphaeraceae bacterium]
MIRLTFIAGALGWEAGAPAGRGRSAVRLEEMRETAMRVGRSILLATAFVTAHLVLEYWSETVLILHFHQFTMTPHRGSIQRQAERVFAVSIFIETVYSIGAFVVLASALLAFSWQFKGRKRWRIAEAIVLGALFCDLRWLLYFVVPGRIYDEATDALCVLILTIGAAAALISSSSRVVRRPTVESKRDRNFVRRQTADGQHGRLP